MIKNVIKKDGHQEVFNIQKIFHAVGKSANRIGKELTTDIKDKIEKEVLSCLNREVVTVDRIHQVVEIALGRVDKDIYNSYTGYRNYRKEMAERMEDIYSEVNKSLSDKDRSNSNMNSDLFSAKRTNVSKVLMRHTYQDFFLTKEELQAFKDGKIYPHDMDNRSLNTTNCCVAHMENIMDGGFTTNGYFCKEPKNIGNAVGVMGDIIISCASAQYGGFTCADVDITLAKYCKKTYNTYIADMVMNTKLKTTTIAELAKRRVLQELDDAIQGLEFQLNTRESSRGDFPFTTFSFGRGIEFWEKEVSKTILKVRREGHGDTVKQTAIFPKLVFIVRDDMESTNKDVFEEAIKTSAKCMYPDYIPESMASPMGCRSFLDDMILPDGTNLNHSRGNIGVVSLNLPLIYQDAKVKNLNFWTELERCMDMIRDIHIRTYEAIGKQQAKCNPIMFTQGGFYGGHLNPNDCIKPITDTFTSSFGITALNELSLLATGKSLREDSSFANEVVDFMQGMLDIYKEEDGYRYSLYASPAESLSGLQVEQFRNRFGVVDKVSDKEYFTNSFHLWVGEDIVPFEKQDKEVELFKKISGGHIQYVRISNPENLLGLYATVLRGVRMGLYQGVNFDACICTSCGAKGHDWNDKCPVCGSTQYNEINRICGYLGWSKKNGDHTVNDSKLNEFADRKSM